VSGQVRIERDGPIGWLVFDHPERRNAIHRAMWEAIPERLAELDADDGVRVVVTRGAGDVAFVAGADISEFEQSRIGPGARDYDKLTERAFQALANVQKPLIAMIHGFCIGGGSGIALHADMRYAADDAVFAIPPARLGLGYSATNVETLVGVVGQAYAREVLLTARRYDAASAERIGLVHQVLPKSELDEFVRGLALQVADNAPLTLRAAKRCLADLRLAATDRDDDRTAALIQACFDSDDYAEGVAAFLAKRRPVFRGR
jgi:enoyl-CoA hydratase/carnithine racemase